MWLLAAASGADWSWVSYLGPFGAAAAAMGLAIAYLRHELTLAQERVAKIADQRLALAERAIPAVQSATEAIRASAEMVEKHASKLGEADVVLQQCREALQRSAWLWEAQQGRQQ